MFIDVLIKGINDVQEGISQRVYGDGNYNALEFLEFFNRVHRQGNLTLKCKEPNSGFAYH